jgi:flagellar biogenesis protein FliO
MYIVGGIILLHFVVGFIWLIYKFSKKKEDN